MILNNEKTIRNYWDERSSRQGAATVGRSGLNLEQQDQVYRDKNDFFCRIFDDLSPSYYTLDYGCGIGRHSGLFAYYLGVDICAQHISIANDRYKNKDFKLISGAHDLRKATPPIERFFTATVLQHCSDEVVDYIFDMLEESAFPLREFVLYENQEANADHCKGRDPDWYVETIAERFPILRFEVHPYLDVELHNAIMVELM